MSCSKAINKLLTIRIIVIKLAVVTIALLILCAQRTVSELITKIEHKDDDDHRLYFSWHCVLVSGMCFLLLLNLALVVGVLQRRIFLLRLWIYINCFVLIGLLHVLIVELLVRKMSMDWSITTSLFIGTLWIAAFIGAVYKCLEQMKECSVPEIGLVSHEFV